MTTLAPEMEIDTAPDTYLQREEEQRDRKALKKIAQYTLVPEKWLMRDECSCWMVSGPAGRIYARSSRDGWLGGYLVVCQPGDAHKWAAIKKSLGGTIQQDGDDEGVVLVEHDNLPPVAALRKAIGCAR